MNTFNAQLMKPATAAKKLDVYLPATPAMFRENPEWLTSERANYQSVLAEH